ncbi:unnamed protein product [Trichogramma brassicae]|uniref:Small ribosomal subunit protein eS25 n=1 Tax=Trichogramma brassicae TaxID=86971 RepID=A0A6H5IMU6_9HYME|nr:unnamed protein product [Trichogramma brassicae]
MPPKKDSKGSSKQPQKTVKKKEGGSGGKAKKKKWSKGKVRDKLNNQVLFDKSTYDKLLKEVPSYKLITPSILSERLKIRGSLARRALIELQQKGLIKQVVQHHAQLIYTRTTKGDDPCVYSSGSSSAGGGPVLEMRFCATIDTIGNSPPPLLLSRYAHDLLTDLRERHCTHCTRTLPANRPSFFLFARLRRRGLGLSRYRRPSIIGCELLRPESARRTTSIYTRLGCSLARNFVYCADFTTLRRVRLARPTRLSRLGFLSRLAYIQRDLCTAAKRSNEIDKLVLARASCIICVAAVQKIVNSRARARRYTRVLLSDCVDPDNSVATVKEEEWETRKKKEITTTRQIETRVKRQVVLEDGEVVGDTGPIVTTNTTEDVEQQEHTTQERRTTGDEPLKVDWPSNVKTVGPVVQKELEETVVKSREEVEERVETEDRQHMGDISDEAYLRAVRNNRDGDIRLALAESRRQLAETSGLSKGPRVLAHTTRSNKVIDTEKTLERSELKPEGQIVTERKTTVEHEEIKDDEAPEDLYDGEAAIEDCGDKELYRKEATQRYLKRRDEDLVDYVSASTGERLGREMRYVSESTEAERTGDWPGQSAEDQQTFSGLRSSSQQQDRLYKNGITSSCGPPPPSVPPNHSILNNNNNNNNNNNLKHRINNNHQSNGGLHKKVIEVVTESSQNENVARKFETSKWLESHFGSESRSSSEFDEEEDADVLKSAAKDRASSNSNNNTSFINVTMKSNNVASVEVKTSTSKEQNVVKNNNNNNNAKVPTNKAGGGGGGFFQGISEWSERYQSIERLRHCNSAKLTRSLKKAAEMRVKLKKILCSEKKKFSLLMHPIKYSSLALASSKQRTQSNYQIFLVSPRREAKPDADESVARAILRRIDGSARQRSPLAAANQSASSSEQQQQTAAGVREQQQQLRVEKTAASGEILAAAEARRRGTHTFAAAKTQGNERTGTYHFT